MSAALPWPPQVDGTAALGLAVAVGLALQLEALGLEPRLKWPNDLLVQGAKVAGLLPRLRRRGERIRWAQVGLGLNGHNPVPPGGWPWPVPWAAAASIPLRSLPGRCWPWSGPPPMPWPLNGCGGRRRVACCCPRLPCRSRGSCGGPPAWRATGPWSWPSVRGGPSCGAVSKLPGSVGRPAFAPRALPGPVRPGCRRAPRWLAPGLGPARSERPGACGSRSFGEPRPPAASPCCRPCHPSGPPFPAPCRSRCAPTPASGLGRRRPPPL
ncbi:hypothetical protein [Cyanobium sp. ATX-6F1]|uniref:hypothetical protein n=1 Tax=Cyanobium sp. ATX-6F1 TaxID=3137388 RepID=UPI0039BE8313